MKRLLTIFCLLVCFSSQLSAQLFYAEEGEIPDIELPEGAVLSSSPHETNERHERSKNMTAAADNIFLMAYLQVTD